MRRPICCGASSTARRSWASALGYSLGFGAASEGAAEPQSVLSVTGIEGQSLFERFSGFLELAGAEVVAAEEVVNGGGFVRDGLKNLDGLLEFCEVVKFVCALEVGA